jgi:hypothetical protein
MTLGAITPSVKACNQLCVAENRDISVMRCEEELTTVLLFTHTRYPAVRDKPIVQIILRLIDDKGRRTLQKK